MSKPQQIDFPLKDGRKIPATVQVIEHRDKTISAILKVTLDNGKPLKMKAKAVPQEDKEDFWHIDCLGWTTGSNTKELYGAIGDLFRTNIDVFNSLIEAQKYVEVRVRIPKDGGCEKCPVLKESGWLENELVWNRMWRCNYLDVDILDICTKHEDCPALKYTW